MYSAILYALVSNEAKSNLASEFAKCSAYYSLMGLAVERQQENIEQFIQAAYLSYSLAVKLSNEEVTKARMELDTKAMVKEINNDWSNGAILINKYAEHCKNIIENTETRMQYWLEE